MSISGAARIAACGICVTPLAAACASNGVDQVIIIDGLSQPRGLSATGSMLCVAEAGFAADEISTEAPAGEVRAMTGRIVCQPSDGEPADVVLDDLPFVHYPAAAVTSGASDVIIDGDTIYALVGEASGRNARSIVAIDESGARQVADLLRFATATAEASGGTIRSNPYSFVADRDGAGFFVSDAATGTVLRVDSNGDVSTFATVAGHEVLTGMTWGPDARMYIASFGQLPHVAGSGAIVAVDESGAHGVVLDGLTMPIDVGFDADGGMYVLEYSTPPEDPSGVDAYRDRSGRLSYVASGASAVTVLLDGLRRPTALSVDGGAIVLSLAVEERGRGVGSVARYELDELLSGSVSFMEGDDQ